MQPFADSPTLPAVACGCGCLAAAVAAWGMVCVRGSTAVPAAGWAVAACLAVAAEMGCRAVGGLADPAAAAAVRLVVVSLSLCPAMAILGAKRPQHGVWQLIVATLAVVLMMPAASARLVRPGSLPDVHLLERCFMPLLVVMGWLNFAATRRAVAATCIALGQLLLMRGLLPGLTQDPGRASAAVDAAAVGLVLAGGLLAAVQAGWAPARSGRSRSSGAGGPASLAAIIDPPFLSIRETLGAAWAIRIAERFDTVAQSHGWPCRLRFGGLDAGGGGDDAAWHRDAVRAFRALARRFVSSDWLARHGWPAGESESGNA